MSDLIPPRRAEFFAAALVADPELRDAVLGDLSEEYARVAQAGSTKSANAWYWSQLFRSAVPLSAMAVAHGGWVGWIRLVFATLLSYAFLVVLVIQTNQRLPHIIGLGLWRFPSEPLIADVFCAVAAGFVASLIGGRSPLAAAMALGSMCVGISLGLLANGGDGSSGWYQVGLSLIVFPSVMAGALIRAGGLVRGRARPRSNA
jgi:hypothetical protein